MEVNYFVSTINHSLSVLIPTTATTSDLPEEVKTQFVEFKLFKTLTIDANAKYVALDAKKAIEDIQKQGYHISRVEITSTWN